MINFNNINTVKNRYSDHYAGNRRTSIELGIELSKGGVYAQFGVYKGASAKWILESTKCEKLYLYDSFEGLPEDWNNNFQKGHFKCEVPFFDDDRVFIHKGLFNETIETFNNIKFDMIHIDCDLYSATKTVLENIIHFENQIFVFDEMYNIKEAENHELKAFYEWTIDKNINYEIVAKTEYSQVIIRIK